MSEVSKSWAIVQFKSNSYKIAERNLNRQSFETFLPFEEIKKYKTKQFISLKRPLFPGYMFISNEINQTPWHKVNCTLGVSKLLTLNNAPHFVPQSIISNIMAKCNQKGVLVSPNHFSNGDSVRLIDGPFNDFLGTVETINKDQRIWILLELMGQARRTSIKAEKLKYSI
jgi:transcriptional antiterminator RfaH